MNLDAQVKIEMPGPAVQGTRIMVDGIEQQNVYKAVLDMTTGDVGRLVLFTFAKVAMEGSGLDVVTVPLCPKCHKALDESQQDIVGSADISTFEDKWRMKRPAEASLLDRAMQLLLVAHAATITSEWLSQKQKLIEEYLEGKQ